MHLSSAHCLPSKFFSSGKPKFRLFRDAGREPGGFRLDLRRLGRDENVVGVRLVRPLDRPGNSGG